MNMIGVSIIHLSNHKDFLLSTDIPPKWGACAAQEAATSALRVVDVRDGMVQGL